MAEQKNDSSLMEPVKMLAMAFAAIGWAAWPMDGCQAQAEAVSQQPPLAQPSPFQFRPNSARPAADSPFEYVEVGPRIPNYLPGRAWGEQGEPATQMQRPLTPAESMRRLVTFEGFHVELFASEPDLQGKPICMAWDHRGRLWVAETVDYPNRLQASGHGHDRIRICEDTDGDGKADRFTLFASGLSIPTSIAFHRNGVIVQNGTETLFLQDTDHDDRADRRQVLFSGWEMRDTHGGVSNFHAGLDNWIWAMQGYNRSRPIVAGQPGQEFRMGFFRFRPDGSQLEFIRGTDNNTWGLGMTEEGIVFGSTANRNPSVYMPIPNRYYEQVRGWKPSLVLGTIADTYLFRPITENIRQVDQHGGYTAGTGHAIYTARTYPREFWNRTAFVNGPTGHLVGTFVLSRQGSDFRSTSPANLLASDDAWTAPIMTEVGPDGCVWVLDWYNYIVQHNPTPHGFETGPGQAYVSDLRDKSHGRIYRIVYDQAPPAPPMSLAGASPQQMVATLRHPNKLWRLHAQRRLVERGKTDVVPALIELVDDTSLDPIGLNVGAIHALWTLHGLGVLAGTRPDCTCVVERALHHPSAGVRRNALQVLPRNRAALKTLLTTGMLGDRDAQVRLQALLAMAEMPINRTAGPDRAEDQAIRQAAGQAIAHAVDQSQNREDRWILDAATSAAARCPVAFLQALLAHEQHSARVLEMGRIIAEHYVRGNENQQLPELLSRLSMAKGPLVERIVHGLAQGSIHRGKPTLDLEAAEIALQKLFQKLSLAGQVDAIALDRSWNQDALKAFVPEVVHRLTGQLEDESLPDRDRVAVARQLVGLGRKDEMVDPILAWITPRTPPQLAIGLLRALQTRPSQGMGSRIARRLSGWTPEVRLAGIGVLLSSPITTGKLLAGLEQQQLQLTDMSLAQRQTLAVYPDESIRRRAQVVLGRPGGEVNPDRQRVLEEYMPLTNQSGDAVGGEKVFLRLCATCHVRDGKGQRIGPDLTGLATGSKRELLTHILDPNRSVEGNFRVCTVVTEKGLVLTGLLASESRTAIELLDAQGKRTSVLREEIEEIKFSRRSLMPEGFEKQLSRQELRDLLEFLRKPVPQRGR